jgi:4-amino-4-deoxy-L-arabinose transferase-like glycosyltransferase
VTDAGPGAVAGAPAESPPQRGLRRADRSDPLSVLEDLLGGNRGWVLAVAAVTLLAGVLRLTALARVPLNPFYDAAVRSMGLSWHNFFFGAFDPSASASIDKPPVDLWLQVLSVKLLGYRPIGLKAPAALASTLVVPLMYDAVRRFCGRPAGLIAALTLAVLPVSVLTARSDTMDSLMMALLVACAWLIVRAGERQRLGYLAGAGVALGLAFNTKLLEALVAAPALAVLAWLLLDSGTARARAGRLALAAGVFVITALSWLTVASLAPAHDRPWPIGSTNGSVWNAAFVFNGTDRLLHPPRPDRYGIPTAVVLLADSTGASGLSSAAAAAGATGPAGTTGNSGARNVQPAAPVAPTRRHRRAAASKAPAGPTRLFQHSTLDYGGLIGVLLLAAIAFGGLALWACRPALVERDGGGRRRVTRAGAGVACVALWLLTGYVLFSFTGRLHQRYLEAFTPAVAAAVGAGIGSLGARPRAPRALAALLGALAVTVIEIVAVAGTGQIQHAGEAAAVLLALALAAAAAIATLRHRRHGQWPWWWTSAVLTTGTVVAVFAFPLARDVRLVRDHSSDEAAAPLFSPALTARLVRYLRAHRQGARYEFAAAAPTVAAPLIIRDPRPILLLTTNLARPLVTLTRLQAAIAAGQVRYVLTRGTCPRPHNRQLPACSAAVEWVRIHGIDVTAQLGGQVRSGVLYQVGAGASTAGA